MKLGADAQLRDVSTVSTGSLVSTSRSVSAHAARRVVEIYGPEASGKTTLALQLVAGRDRRDVAQLRVRPELHDRAPCRTISRSGLRPSPARARDSHPSSCFAPFRPRFELVGSLEAIIGRRRRHRKTDGGDRNAMFQSPVSVNVRSGV